MICYRDRSYCGSKVKKHTCGREFTKQDAKDAERWWGNKDYPVAYTKFCDEAEGQQLGDKLTSERKASKQANSRGSQP